MVLQATFQFTISDTDTDILKKVTWQTFGAVSGGGEPAQPISSDILSEFKAEKKFWLGQAKALRKAASKAESGDKN